MHLQYRKQECSDAHRIDSVETETRYTGDWGKKKWVPMPGCLGLATLSCRIPNSRGLFSVQDRDT
jgi:hypothetical protein